MFQLAELGCTVKDARAKGMSAACDNSEHLPRFPVVTL